MIKDTTKRWLLYYAGCLAQGTFCAVDGIPVTDWRYWFAAGAYYFIANKTFLRGVCDAGKEIDFKKDQLDTAAK